MNGNSNSNLEKARDADLEARIQDAYRFIIHFKVIIENYPLQVYYSAMFFAPRSTITRNQYEPDKLRWLNTNKITEEGWGQCLQTLQGHAHIISSVTFSSSNTMLASGDYDGTIKIWDTRSGHCLQTLEGQGGWVRSLAFSPGNMWLASGGDTVFEIWKTETWQHLSIIEGVDVRCSSVRFSPNEARLALGHGSHIDIWDTKTWKCLQTLDSEHGEVSSVAFSFNSSHLALGCEAHIEFWCTKRWQCLHILDTGRGVNSVAFSPNSKLLACGNDKIPDHKGSIQIWDVENWQLLQKLQHTHAGVESVVFSNDGSKLASVAHNDDYGIRVWNTDDWQCINYFKGHHMRVSSVAFSNDDAQLASSSYDGTVKVWDIHRKMSLRSLGIHLSSLDSIDFSPDGALCGSGSDDGTFKIWDTQTGKCLQTIKNQLQRGCLVKFSPDGLLLVCGDHYGTIEVWELSSWKCLRTLKHTGNCPFKSQTCLISFSPNGLMLVTCWDRSPDGLSRAWDTQSWKCLHIFSTGERFFGSRLTVFSPNSTLFVCGYGNLIKVFDTGNWHLIQTIHLQGKEIKSLIFSSDGTLLASGTTNRYSSPGETIEFWDITSWQRVQILKGYGIHIRKLDVAKSYLQTERGIFTLPFPADPACSTPDPEGLPARGFGVSEDRNWITWNSSNLLKLPSDYIISTFVASECSIGIGCKSGRIILLNAPSHGILENTDIG